MIRVGVIGLGYWGPNLVRNFHSLDDCQVTCICDRDKSRLLQVADRFPGIETTADSRRALDPDLVDAVVIATPTATHFDLALQALSAGVHTFVEKPLAMTADQCVVLNRTADSVGVTLFVGHVFLYSTPVIKLKEMVDRGELGDLYYVSSSRLNLGPVRRDVNALWDLAPHDISILLELLNDEPVGVSCQGLAHLDNNVHDVCNLTMQFEGNRMGMIHVSWLDPKKRRVMTVVGSEKMAIYDDLEPLEKIKVYDIGVEKLPYTDSFDQFKVSYRYGDTFSPRLNEVEPLKAEATSFIDAIRTSQRPKTDGYNGLKVVKVLEAASRSLSEDGRQIAITDLSDSSDLIATDAVSSNGRPDNVGKI